MSRQGRVLLACASMCVLAFVPMSRAFAQEQTAEESAHARQSERAARDQVAAADAYDRGTEAYLARDFSRAADWFETAHRLAPASAALIQATRAHLRTERTLRACTLALRLLDMYPTDAQAVATANRALLAADAFVRVQVRCDGCDLLLDGGLLEHSSFFIEPHRSYRLEASFPGDEEHSQVSSTQSVAGEPGQTLELDLPRPPDPPTRPEELSEPAGGLDRESQEFVGEGDVESGEASLRLPVTDNSGLSVPLYVTLTAGGLTMAAAGMLLWSGLDTLDGAVTYAAAPTVEGLVDGQSREERTNWLILSTSILAATTVALLWLTDYSLGASTSGEPSENTSRGFRILAVGLAVQDSGFVLGLSGEL